MNWTSGYVADVEYTHGYYPELNPLRIKLALTSFGLKAPDLNNACELGYGQGVSLCINSCHSGINWYGTDFNPSQALYADHLSRQFNPSTNIYDDDFATFCSRKDLPQFDFICLHGIWSWVSDANRRVITDFVKTKLAVGGVLYISYNSQPGWSSMIPFRDMLTRHANTISPQGSGIIERIDHAIEFAEQLMEAAPTFKAANPQIETRLAAMKEQDRRYLAHEYFNEDWRPMGFAEISNILTEAKLTFAGSANFADHVPHINFSEEQLNLLHDIKDPIYREVVKDIFVNQSFRKDYWVKGTKRLTQYERSQAFSNIEISWVSSRNNFDMQVKGNRGEASLTEEVYTPIINILEKNDKISIGDLANSLKGKLNEGQILEATAILMSKNSITVAADDNISRLSNENVQSLNNFLTNEAITKDEIKILVSPVTLSGIPVTRFEKLFILALFQNCRNADEIAKFAWKILEPQGQRIVKEGKTLEAVAENVQFLNSHAQDFLKDTLPKLKKLKVVEL